VPCISAQPLPVALEGGEGLGAGFSRALAVGVVEVGHVTDQVGLGLVHPVDPQPAAADHLDVEAAVASLADLAEHRLAAHRWAECTARSPTS
jgi:hypothetical protein